MINIKAFISNKPLYFNIVLAVTAIAMLLTRQIPLLIILFVVLMIEGDIIIALKLKKNSKKAFLYMIIFMTIMIAVFVTLIFTQLDNENFRRMLMFIL